MLRFNLRITVIHLKGELPNLLYGFLWPCSSAGHREEVESWSWLEWWKGGAGVDEGVSRGGMVSMEHGL